MITVIATQNGGAINLREPYDLAFTCSWDNLYLKNVRKAAFLEIFYCYILIQPITFIKNVILMFISIGL
ncbi:hypothetical protein QTH04_00520 [Clostridium perfringens]|nr:hypothetical protein [Clostridium perfringens]